MIQGLSWRRTIPMALLEDMLAEVLDSLPPPALLGVLAVAALAFPTRVPGVRLVAKELLKGGLVITQGIGGLVGEIGAEWGEVVTEARAELGQSVPPRATARRAGRRIAQGATKAAAKTGAEGAATAAVGEE